MEVEMPGKLPEPEKESVTSKEHGGIPVLEPKDTSITEYDYGEKRAVISVEVNSEKDVTTPEVKEVKEEEESDSEDFGKDAAAKPKECFFNASLVLEDISCPDQTFTVSGYIEVWWKDPVKVSIATWSKKKVAKWVKHVLKKRIMKKQANAIAQRFYENDIDGDILLDLSEQNLRELGISSIGLRKVFLKERKLCQEKNKAHEVNELGHVDDIEHLQAPFNWEDLFYNATSEEFLTDPIHRLLNEEEEGADDDEATTCHRMSSVMTPLSSVGKEIAFEEEREDVVWGLYHIRTTLLEAMELHNFPLDRQFLDVRLTADKTGKRCKWHKERPEWVPASSEGVTILGNNNDQLLQVRLSEKLQGAYRLEDPLVDFETDADSILLRLRVTRRYGYYETNVFVPIFLIVLSAFGAFAVPYDEVADRMSVTVTMFLVVIAYQYVVSEMLPLSSDNTILNQYVTCSFVMMTFLVAENAFLGFVEFDADLVEKIDKYCLYITLSFWVVSHVLFKWFHEAFRESWDLCCEQDDNCEIWLPAEDKQTMFVTYTDGESCLQNAKGKDVTAKTHWNTQFSCFRCIKDCLTCHKKHH